MSQTRIEIQNGKLISGKESLKNILRSADDGLYMIKLEEWQTAKTKRQNAFFHGPVVDAYSEYTGYTKTEAKYMLKKYFGVNRLVKDKNTGKQELMIRSIAKYKKEEMSTFLDRVMNHLEYDCGMVIDSETRKQFMLDEETGELVET